MFKFLLPTSNYKGATRARHAINLTALTLIGSLLLTACNQPASPDVAPESQEVKTEEQQRAEDSQSVTQSDSATARIEQFQPLYVEQVLGLQRRLQAEYESLQAADISESETGLLSNSTQTQPNQASATESTNDQAATAESAPTDTQEKSSDINTSTEVGERDLSVLKRISLEPRKPNMLTQEQIIENYQQAMQALYEPVTSEMSAKDTDTLLNIAALIPQLFEHAEIANRVNAKSPALARLIIQRQVWQQIEAQQVLDMQQLKLSQQQEFETLMSKFNDTIKDYDEQIAKYEQTLKEFQQ
ncbi:MULTISPECIES: hypothetical protein [unclassified Psychrobacter]|uniref:hypothetical protein n=1 Tax=unclassified Psychrobacter TaxID=196806 RepID=UPI003FD26959